MLPSRMIDSKSPKLARQSVLVGSLNELLVIFYRTAQTLSRQDETRGQHRTPYEITFSGSLPRLAQTSSFLEDAELLT